LGEGKFSKRKWALGATVMAFAKVTLRRRKVTPIDDNRILGVTFLAEVQSGKKECKTPGIWPNKQFADVRLQ